MVIVNALWSLFCNLLIENSIDRAYKIILKKKFFCRVCNIKVKFLTVIENIRLFCRVCNIKVKFLTVIENIRQIIVFQPNGR